MIVTFCGHSDLDDPAFVRRWLTGITGQLIEEGADTFYLGGYGAFDLLAAEVLREQKRTHPHITLVLILPYLNFTRIGTDGYDETIYPPLETVPKRYTIVHRNRWMVEQADTVVAYVRHEWGGAAKTLAHAQRKKKRIFNGAEEGPQ